MVRGPASRWATARHAATGSRPVVLLGNRACPLANTASIYDHPTYAIGVTPAFPPLRKRCQPDPHPPFLAPLAVGKPLSCLVAKFCWVYFCLDLLPANKTPPRSQHCRYRVAAQDQGPRCGARGMSPLCVVGAGLWPLVRGPWTEVHVTSPLCAVGRAQWALRRGPLHEPWPLRHVTCNVDILNSDPEARPSDHGPCTLALEPLEKEEVSCGCIISLYYNGNMVTASMRCGWGSRSADH
jgi:hypothetical protein